MIGRPVVQQLSEDGFEVTIGSRYPEHIRKMFKDRYPAIHIDLTSLNTIHEALIDQDAVHISLPSGPRFNDCFTTESQGVANLIAQIGNTNIKRISYLSGNNVSQGESFPPARAKWLAEEKIRECGVPFTIWRPTWFAETLTKLARFGVIAMFGKGEASAHWLTAKDFGKWVSKSFSEPKAENQTYYPYGPEEVSLRKAVEIYRDICYPLRPIVSSPIGVVSVIGKASHRWDMWFGAEMFKFLEKMGEMGDPAPGVELFGQMTTTIEDFARERAGI